MNILSVSNWNNSNPYQIDTSKKAVSYPYFGLKMARPLTCDTVSFTGKLHLSKPAKKSVASIFEDVNMSEIGKTIDKSKRGKGVSKATAKRIYEKAEPLQKELEKFFTKYFAPLIADEKHPDRPIYTIKGRVKSVDSIVEKSEGLGLSSMAEVFSSMTDLNGIKIEMRDGSPKSIKAILKFFSDAVDNGFLIPVQVENKRPIAAKELKGLDASKWDYFAPEVLEDFVKGMEKSCGEKIEFNPHDYTKANYTAVHFLFRLPGQKRCFEVQLMGKDVAAYKDFDDIIYKCLGNKNVSAKYKKIKNIIEELKQPEKKEILDNFNKQRQDTFLFQREKEPTLYQRSKTSFLPLKYDIPEKYDINKLYELYLECKGEDNGIVKTIAGKSNKQSVSKPKKH